MPGYEALTRKSELSLEDRNSAIDIFKFKDVMIEAQEQIYRDRRAELGITYENIPYAVLKPITEAQMLDVLNDLRERFSVPINVLTRYGETPSLEGDWAPMGGKLAITITTDGLRQMAGDPVWHQSVIDQIQNAIDGSSSFSSKAGTTVTALMQIDSSSINFGLAIRDHLSDSEMTRVKDAWKEFMQALIALLKGRDEEYELFENYFDTYSIVRQ